MAHGNEFKPTADGADEYFNPNNHNRGPEWGTYDATARLGALATSKRELEAYLDRELEIPGSGEIFDSVDSDAHDDWACYEQALDILDRQLRISTTSKVKKLGASQDEPHTGFRISPIALNYARVGRLKIAKG